MPSSTGLIYARGSRELLRMVVVDQEVELYQHYNPSTEVIRILSYRQWQTMALNDCREQVDYDRPRYLVKVPPVRLRITGFPPSVPRVR